MRFGVLLECLGSENIGRHEPALNPGQTSLCDGMASRTSRHWGSRATAPDVAAAESQTGQREPLADAAPLRLDEMGGV